MGGKRWLIISVFLLGMGCTAAAGRTIYVDDDGPADFNNIQAAINDANNGDTVVVADGIYTGDGNRDLDFGGKAITVRSTNPEDPCVVVATIIDCNGSYSNNHRGFYFHSGEDANSVVSGLTITRGLLSSWPADSNTKGGGIYCSGSSPTIENCYIINNKCLSSEPACGGGIYCESGSNPVIIGCNIENNYAEGKHAYGGGICSVSSWPKVINCVISGNTAKGVDSDFFPPNPSNPGHGIGGGLCAGRQNLAGSGFIAGSMTVNNCTIVSNNAIGGDGALLHGAGYGGGCMCFEGNMDITDCIFWDNDADVFPQVGFSGDANGLSGFRKVF